jgi:site-specific DNA-methyltransferase (adenine-specific)
MTVTLHTGDCLDVMAAMEPDSVDSIVTDPPYGLAFMGKDWDHGVPGIPFWKAALRVAKPGAHLLAFGGTRTFHRLAVAIEDAGWELRDTVMWCYGSGFPKSHNVSVAIDKAAGAEREVVGRKPWKPGPTYERSGQAAQGYRPDGKPYPSEINGKTYTAPATPDAERWAGWGTALKPAWEPVIVARKPFPGTVAANVLAWGTGAINVDGCRVEADWANDPSRRGFGYGWNGNKDDQQTYKDNQNGDWGMKAQDVPWQPSQGRWPANLVHDGSDEVLALFPVTTSMASMRGERGGNIYGNGKGPTGPDTMRGHNDTGSAARFFPAFAHDAEDIEAARFMYCAKASRADRDDGLEGMEARAAFDNPNGNMGGNMGSRSCPRRNHHPTVKPTPLMRWLCRLVTPPGGVVLDPFMGSGSTGKGAALEGFSFVGIDREAEYVEIARRRIDAARLPLFAEVAA